MLADLKLKTLRDLVKDATRDELVWMNGFISAFLEVLPQGATASNGRLITTQGGTLAGSTILYGTESGNSKKLAVDFSNRLKKQGLQAKIKSLDQYKVTDLAKETCLLVVISTQGDGEPPAAAKKFYDYLMQNEVALSHLKYGVLALGDTSYPLFCQAGEDVDLRLNKLGAQRLIPLKKCDTDFEDEAHLWIDELILSATPPAGDAEVIEVIKNKPAKSGKKTYDGRVVTSINLNDRGSAKETYHVEIASEDEVVYEPGDSIGIIAENNVVAAAKILELLDLGDGDLMQYKDQPYTAIDLFTKKINIQYLPERVIQQYAKLVGKEVPSMRMDLADLLRIYPADKGHNLQQFLAILEPVAPRLYSISSSPAAHGPTEVHITVCRSKFNIDGHTRYGLCSDYLSLLEDGQKLQFYVQKNSAFKLPATETDAIMIGPGTGIAPFRSFLFEREAQNATGRNWLFFGDQHFVTDFLYQTELQSLMETGVLTKLNTAFSRDQQQKVYVQHRMLQQSAELFTWIENGANVYICGSKDPMSADVEDALINIIATEKDIHKTEAKGYLQQLKEAGRYHKDVY